MSLSNSTNQLDKQQDFSFSTKINNNIWLVVADGHASLPLYSYKYRTVIEYISNLDWKTFLEKNSEHPLNILQQDINYHIQDTKHNGATITIVNINTELNKIKIWWKGDSQAHIFEDNKLIYKTPIHNIFNEKEKERLKYENIEYIQDKKGKNFKLLGKNHIKMVDCPSYVTFNKDEKINMTNCLGHNGATGNFIEYYDYNLKKDSKYKIIVATDGLWDMYFQEEDEEYILNTINANELTSFAEKKWKQDWLNIWKDKKYRQTFPIYDDIGVAMYYN